MLVVLQKGSKAVRCWFSWRWKAARVCGGTVGGAAVVDCITVDGAVEVNYSAAGRQQGVSLAAGKAAEVYSGGSTVPAAVVIVVEYRACLSVGRLIVGVQARSIG